MREDNILKLLKIAETHKQAFTSVRKWNEYAKEHNLPSSRQFIHAFESWKNARKAVGIKSSSIKYEGKYTKKELKEIINKHSKEFSSKENWYVYAKENGLPTYETFVKYFENWNEVQKLAGFIPNKLSNDDLIKIAKKHKESFISKNKWNEYAKEHNLPSAITYIRRFDSWSNIYEIIHQPIEKKRDS